MVAYTASQLLPYAEDGDRVCDSPEILQELAETVEARIGSLEDTYQGLVLRPAGKMHSTHPTYVPFTTIDFDQVDFDIGNIIDLSIDHEAIRVPPIVSGNPDESWAHGSYYVCGGTGVNTDMIGAELTNPGGTDKGDQRDNGAFNFGHMTMLFELGSGTLEPRCYTELQPVTAGSVPATVDLSICEQWAYKIGDLS